MQKNSVVGANTLIGSTAFPLTFKYCRWWGLLAQLLTTGTQLNSSALLNGGTSAPLLAIYCWQQLNFQNNGWNKTGNCPKSR